MLEELGHSLVWPKGVFAQMDCKVRLTLTLKRYMRLSIPSGLFGVNFVENRCSQW